MGYPLDGWIEGPGLPQSVWRYKWLVGGLVLLGILTAFLFSAVQPTRYEGVVRIYLTADEVATGDTERMVMSHAQFIGSPTVADRVIALTGNRLSRTELEEQLEVEPSADADFITIRALDTTPTDAAGLAEAVDRAYRQILSEQRQAAANQAIAALEEVQRRLASELADIQAKQRTGDSPVLAAQAQAKRREMEATADKIEEVSADAAGSPPVLQDKAAVPDEPVQPKPLLAAAIGGVVGLLIGIALAWLLAARQRVRAGDDTAESQTHIDDDLEQPVEETRDLVEQPRKRVPAPHGESEVLATASDIQGSPQQVRNLADVNDNRVTGPVGQAVSSLDEDPDLLYSLAEWLESQHQNYPQVTAERLRDRLLFDRVAVLLKTDEGLDLAGCVGWRPEEVRPVGHHDPSILNKLSGNGVRRIGSAERGELLNAGLPESESQTIVVAPLVHGNVAFGFLLVGQEEPDSEASAQGNGSFAGIGSFARSVAPDLHAWLLLRHLREQLAAHGRAHGQTAHSAELEPPFTANNNPADSEPASSPNSQPLESEPSAESQSPSSKYQPPPAKSKPPPTKSKSASARFKSASAKSKSASAKFKPPSAESEPPSRADSQLAQAEPPVVVSEPVPSAGSQPAGPEPPPSAGSQPAEPEPPLVVSEPPPSAGSQPAGPEPPPSAGSQPAGPEPPPSAGSQPAGPEPPPSAGSQPAGPEPPPSAGSQPAGPEPPPPADSQPAEPEPSFLDREPASRLIGQEDEWPVWQP